MAITLTSLDPGAFDAFDEVIDARAPAEYAEDHIPGAVNLPVLDDAERARVGTIYTQQSPFEARRIGAALVARNVARHLERHFAARGRDYRPLVYCWRGGQRSGAFATILGQVGWRPETLEGGYRSWRRLVKHALYDRPMAAPVVVLDGDTGTAKTGLLARMAARGVQVIDLEALAGHRGSLFGTLPGGQPAQKGFETALARRLAGLDPAQPVVVEAESSRIGALNLPPALWRAMRDAPRLTVTAPLNARARYLVRAYPELVADRAMLRQRLDRLRPFHARVRIEHWQALAEDGAMEALARELMLHHYDPRYARARSAAGELLRLDLPSLEPDALEDAAARLARHVSAGPADRSGAGTRSNDRA